MPDRWQHVLGFFTATNQPDRAVIYLRGTRLDGGGGFLLRALGLLQ